MVEAVVGFIVVGLVVVVAFVVVVPLVPVLVSSAAFWLVFGSSGVVAVVVLLSVSAAGSGTACTMVPQATKATTTAGRTIMVVHFMVASGF